MEHRIIRGAANQFGWRPLFFDSPSVRVGRIPDGHYKSIFNVIQISDTHICDAQSPARVEFLDKYADPHNALSSVIGSLVGTYRAQEILTNQVLESMIQATNQIAVAPISNMPIDALLFTGDLTDNAQQNELDWFLVILEGGKIIPDSGSPLFWEGIGGANYSVDFWHPHGTPKGEIEDNPRSLYGFPEVPELLDAIRSPFNASGSSHQWLAVHGNHDALLQGTVKANLFLNSVATGKMKYVEISDEEAMEVLVEMREIGPASYPDSKNLSGFEMTADVRRQFVNSFTWPQRMTEGKDSHGLQLSNRGTSIKYWRRDFENVVLIALDTVNPHGGWQGSLDIHQSIWLEDQLEQVADKYVVITSHHPLQDLFNTFTPSGTEPRIDRVRVEQLLYRYPNVILWIAGHTHRNRVTYFGENDEIGFWQIETSSLIDWPQQGRIIEIIEIENEGLFIVSSMVDHNGKVDVEPNSINLNDLDSLAGLSRLLSVNDWQRRNGPFAIEYNEGSESDQNSILRLPMRNLREIAGR